MNGALLAALLSAAPCPRAEGLELTAPQVESLCALAARQAPSAEPDRARLEDIFSRDRYARSRQSDSGAFKAMLDRVRAWFSSFFESSGAQSFSQVTRFVVLTLAAVLAAIGALRLAGRWSLRRVPRGGGEDIGPEPLQLDSPAEHLARARAALANAPREAIRQGLFALLSALEDARLARPDRVRTNRELVGELPARGADARLVERVEPLMRWYDGAFYSLDPVPPEGAGRFVENVEQLSKELEQRP